MSPMDAAVKELSESKFWRAVFAEFFGTFVLLFVGLCNILAAEYNNQIDSLIAPAWTFGAIIATLIHLIGPTSGCHINPAVTIALVVQGRCSVVRGVCYFIVQIIGATAGAGLTFAISPHRWIDFCDLGINKLNRDLNDAQGLLIEIIGTCILVLVVLVISDKEPKKDYQGFPALTAGLAVFALVLFMGPYTGCSLNPARSVGPALIIWKFGDYHWIYWVGPILGGLIAVGLHKLIFVEGLHQDVEVKRTENELIESP